MILIIVIFIQLLINYSNSCELYETKRTCQCTATYIENNNITRMKLLELPNIVYCESNQECANTNQCKKECLTKIRFILGNNENYVNLQAKNRICELISPDNEPKNKIFLWATWTYSGCSSGNEPIVQDLCCNNKCKCSISSQIVSKNLNESSEKIIKDFTLALPVKSKSFECSSPILDECQTDCLTLISYYFDEPKILQSVNNNVLNLNIFFNNLIANKMCLDLDFTINKPGVDIFVRIDTSENNGLVNHVALGRVCCQMKCKCEYVIRDAFNSSLISKDDESEFLLDTSNILNVGYECSDELSSCMNACRRKGVEIALLNNDLDEKQTTLDLDVLKINENKENLCDLIKQDKSRSDVYPGYNIYLRYSLNDYTKYPYSEDLHLGRLCCRFTLQNYIGVNRCLKTDPK